MDTLSKLRKLYQNQVIERENFWSSMQARHLILREYSELLAEGEVESIKLTREGLLIKLNDGIHLEWDPEEVRGSANVYVNEGYNERGYLELLERLARNCEVIFDIGANVGLYTLKFANAAQKGATVHAFEPIPETYERLQRNLRLNKFQNIIKTNNCALSNREHVVEFFVPSYSGSVAASMCNLHPKEDNKKIEVPGNTLDKYVEDNDVKRIELMKIDVEGAELLVLEGGINAIKKFKPIICIELLRKWCKEFGYHPNCVLALLKDIGYQAYTLFGEEICEVSEITDQTKQTNFICAIESVHACPKTW